MGTTRDPLLKELIRYVMADEARHVAFGILSLQEVYKELSGDELRERQDLKPLSAFEACDLMRRRSLNPELWRLQMEFQN